MLKKNTHHAGTWRPLQCLHIVALFIAIYLLFLIGYRAMPESVGRSLNHTLNAKPAAWLLNSFVPGVLVQTMETRLLGMTAGIDIRKGCEGFEVIGLLLAGILAFPTSWRARIAGLVGGVAFVYGLNLVRIIGLFLVYERIPAWGEAAHIIVGQAFVILLVLVYLYGWIEWVTAPKPAAGAPFKAAG